jgi:hypothetical protein
MSIIIFQKLMQLQVQTDESIMYLCILLDADTVRFVC